MNAFAYSTVNLRIDGNRAFIEFNRPEKRNSMSPQLHEDMNSAFKEIKNATDIKVLVITGSGSSFCAGMDLEQSILEKFKDPDAFAELSESALSWFREIRNFRGVTIAAVNGWCVGGGMLVAGICDIAIAANDAQFGLSEVNFAVLPGSGLTWITAQHLRRKEALYYLLTGRLFDGVRAAELGFVNYAVPSGRLVVEVDALSMEIANKNHHALVAIKQTYDRSVQLDFDHAVEWEAAKFFELSYLSREEWLDVALRQFSERKFKPGLTNYDPKKV